MERRPRTVIIAIAVAALLAGTAVWILAPAAPRANCALPAPIDYPKGQWYTLADCPSTLDLGSNSARVYPVVRLSDAEMVVGQLSANLSVGVYLLNSSELGQLPPRADPAAPPTEYLWTGGTNVTGCNLSVHIPPSPTQAYVVVENLGPAPVAVHWSKTLAIYYEPTGPSGHTGGTNGWTPEQCPIRHTLKY